ncbi:unnamed protein product [Cuscuta europaea]|uniref:No apical meristem-associated C-terminal domain-containing protein n=1 Tax=Cuscuta europaea TaxID=41803 RepID=A0A9P0ZGB8_CUSEU|nr:unnamed protein product [Cuscuta europaea]
MLFCQQANTTVRTREAVESRFKVINHQCSLWKGSLRKANATQRSGSNLIDVTFAAKIIFVNDNHNKAFKFDHAWHILQACLKWYQQYDTTPTFRHVPSVTPDTFVGGSSGSSPSDGISGPLRRPEGHDKQKGKKIAKNKNSRTNLVMLEYMERMLKQGEQMEKRREEKYEAAKENVDATTRLRHICRNHGPKSILTEEAEVAKRTTKCHFGP